MTTPASVQAQISAVTFQQGVAALAALASSLSSGSGSLPSGALIAVEDIIGLVDPALIPVLGGIQLIMPLVSEALGVLAAGNAAPANDPISPNSPTDFSRGR